MKKYFVLLLLSFILVSCGKQETQPITIESPKNIEQKVSESKESVNVENDSISNTGKVIEIGSGKTVENSSVNIEKEVNNIINQTGNLSLPNNIWGNKENITYNQLIVSNDGWNINTDLKVAPEGTINEVWGFGIFNKDFSSSLNIVDVNLIISEIHKNGFDTYKMFDNSEMYGFGFEGNGAVNISLTEILSKNGISNISKSDLSKTLIAGHSQPEKKIYYTRDIKNKIGEIIGYGSACSFSQDPGSTISFNNYCIITFDGKFIKEYIYVISDKFLKNYDYDVEKNIKSKYQDDGDKEKYINSDFYKETVKFGEKVFTDLYKNNKEFTNYINELESIAIDNY